jgi:hypothetical protein
MKDQHSNIVYTVGEDNSLTIKIDLNHCIEVKENGRYAIASTHGHKELFKVVNGEVTHTGLYMQLYVSAMRGVNKRGPVPEMIRRIRDMWPELEASAQERLKESREDPELG